MKRAGAVMTGIAAIGIAACQPCNSNVWFDGGLQEARTVAAERGTMVMVEFFASWCSWCRRLDEDTFSVAEVQKELAALVAIRVDAEQGGADLAKRFGIDSYPTLVFLDANGAEVDRILGYLPPDEFLRRVQRIRTGDTFLACLRQLEEDPGNVEAIRRSVAGLLERSDPEGAISRIESFHEATDGDEAALCRELMFMARAELHERVYQRAARLYRRGWDRAMEVPDTTGTARLRAMLSEGLRELPSTAQAMELRMARQEDASDLLELPDLETTPAEDLLDVADFALRNGHYDLASTVYLRWYDAAGGDADGNLLNDVAWSLYLAGIELERATEIARLAYDKNPTGETADTLARLLYATGSVDEAIVLENWAADATEGSRSESHRGVAARMGAGEQLGDRPSFDSYPGQRQRSL